MPNKCSIFTKMSSKGAKRPMKIRFSSRKYFLFRLVTDHYHKYVKFYRMSKHFTVTDYRILRFEKSFVYNYTIIFHQQNNACSAHESYLLSKNSLVTIGGSKCPRVRRRPKSFCSRVPFSPGTWTKTFKKLVYTIEWREWYTKRVNVEMKNMKRVKSDILYIYKKISIYYRVKLTST